MRDPGCELRRTLLPKLSEKPRGRLWHSLTDRREGSFRPISPSSYRPDPRSEPCSYPFRTVSPRTRVNRREKKQRRGSRVSSNDLLLSLSSSALPFYLVCR